MPINEATNTSQLSAEQKRAAEAAVYGLPAPAPVQPDLSPQEIEQMRRIIQRHDAQSQSQIREFDLNKPPREMTNPANPGPYRYQPFPRMLYEHGLRTWRIVQNQNEMEHFLTLGWMLEPFPAQTENEPELDAATLAEVAQVDAEARKKRK